MGWASGKTLAPSLILTVISSHPLLLHFSRQQNASCNVQLLTLRGGGIRMAKVKHLTVSRENSPDGWLLWRRLSPTLK
jgi:hypothetical protein